ncbi:MAG: hypothetical protein Q9P01_16070 [Anaerolineae bacterium]|nr:hypothetical protein [Anaerolineae bacterium]MDQ7036285.1 hypothetical protein [Anaerolineae bacterium]
MPDKIIPTYESDSGEFDDPRPLPFIVAERWGFPLQSHDTEEGVLYAIQDWITGIASTSSKNATKMWTKMKSQLSTSSRHLNYLAKNGKKYKMDFTNDEGLYQIAAYMRATKSRPALRVIKDFLAKSGAFADEARREPETVEAKLAEKRKKKWLRQGKPEEWITIRNIGIVTRKELMAIIKHLLNLESNDKYFITVTEETYLGVFGMRSWELREHLGIPKGANIREFMSTLGLIFTAQAEEVCRLELENYRDDEVVAKKTVTKIIKTLSQLVGQQVKITEKRLGRDVLTGRKLLSDGNLQL